MERYSLFSSISVSLIAYAILRHLQIANEWEEFSIHSMDPTLLQDPELNMTYALNQLKEYQLLWPTYQKNVYFVSTIFVMRVDEESKRLKNKKSSFVSISKWIRTENLLYS